MIPEKISKKMFQVLRDGFNNGKITSCPKNTKRALINRALLNDDGSLTQEGFLIILARQGLKKQCKKLELSLNEMVLQYDSQPEIAAYHYFSDKGYTGSFCEGGLILIVIKAMCLDALVELNTFNSRKDACQRYLEAQFTILENSLDYLFKSMQEISKARFLENFQEILSYSIVQEVYPGLTSNAAEKFYDIVGKTSIENVAKEFSRDPYQYRNGWPDLTLMKTSQIEFIEVKTNDKLHRNQFITIQAMRKLLPGKFSVLKLTRPSS
jgi:hypothetical protein